MNNGEVGINAVCRLFDLHLHSFCTLAVIELMATDRPVSEHAHAAGGVQSVNIRWLVLVFLERHGEHLREIWRFERGDQRPDIDGDDGDDDAGQEDGGQFVDIFHTHKHQQRHKEETDGAVDPHVV